MATYIEDADQDTKVQTEKNADEDKIRFDTAGSERVIINNDGKVGIGANVPSDLLEIRNTSTVNPRIRISNQTDTETYDPSIQFSVGALPAIVFTLGVDDDDSDSFKICKGSTLSANECISIKYATGKVGIGESDPHNQLDVSGAMAIGSYSGITAPANGFLVDGNVGINTSVPKNKLDVGGAAVIGSSYAGVNTAPSNGLLVEGNVGIGTTGPSYKLDVNGDINIPTGSQYKINGVNQSFDKWTQGAGDDIYRSSGKVGINTASPLTKLHVKTDGDVVSIFEDDDNPIILLKDANAGPDLKYAGFRLNSNLLSVGKMPDSMASFTDIMTIDTNTSKVGIGTSPGAKLHVKTDGDLAAIFEDDDNPFILLKDANAGADLKYAGLHLNSNKLSLGKTNDVIASFTDYLTVDTSNGNVGIGTTNPGYKLDVNGDINTSGDIRKNGTAYNNPDYVFDTNYNLMSLEELNNFIKIKKCLPNMPSTEDVKKEGIKLFEHGRLVLEKLEEAYLYIFQLEERIKKLEKNCK